MGTCMISNCRKETPRDDGFCAEHRDRDPKDTIRTLTKALRFYADPAVYSMPVQDMNRHIFPDRGERARKALKQCGIAPHTEQPAQRGERG